MQTLILTDNTTVEWGTPQDLFDDLNDEFEFTLDPCAKPGMQKCAKYFTPEDDGLAQDWSGHTVFMNPPFDNVRKWVEKAIEEGSKPNTKVVALLPVRAGSHWWHDLVWEKVDDFRIVQPPVHFYKNGTQRAAQRAPFGVCIAIYNF